MNWARLSPNRGDHFVSPVASLFWPNGVVDGSGNMLIGWVTVSANHTRYMLRLSEVKENSGLDLKTTGKHLSMSEKLADGGKMVQYLEDTLDYQQI